MCRWSGSPARRRRSTTPHTWPRRSRWRSPSARAWPRASKQLGTPRAALGRQFPAAACRRQTPARASTRCCASGIIVRPVGNYRLPEHLRVTLGTRRTERSFPQRLGSLIAFRAMSAASPYPSSPSTVPRARAKAPSAASSPRGSAGTCSTAARCTGWSRWAASCANLDPDDVEATRRRRALHARGIRLGRVGRRTACCSTARTSPSKIRTEQAGAGASRVAAWPAVRAALTDRQRAFAQRPGSGGRRARYGHSHLSGRPGRHTEDPHRAGRGGASRVAAWPAVRAALTDRQRAFAAAPRSGGRRARYGHGHLSGAPS